MESWVTASRHRHRWAVISCVVHCAFVGLTVCVCGSVDGQDRGRDFIHDREDEADEEQRLNERMASQIVREEDEEEEITLERLKENLHADQSSPINFNATTGDIWQIIQGNVVWKFTARGRPILLLCDRLLVFLPGEKGESRRAAIDDPRAPRPPRGVKFYVMAEGNVFLRLPKQKTIIEAESFFFERYEDGDQLCLIERARFSSTIVGLNQVSSTFKQPDVMAPLPRGKSGGLNTMTFSVSAARLRTGDFEHFSGEDVRASSCDYEVPHFSIGASKTLITPFEDDGEREFLVDFRDASFELGGQGIVPLPVSHWDTRWHDYLPIRDVSFGISSKYGVFGGVDWNLNFFLDLLPLEALPALHQIERRSKLDFETTYFEKRGLGWGPKGRYGDDPRSWAPWQKGEEWNYYGESRYFAIHDGGEDFSLPLQFSDPNRSFVSVSHRQGIPYLGTLDVEYSESSDANFLREYLESIAKLEKEQESLFYLRRNLTDNAAATFLYKYRTDDFRSEVERLPEGKFFLMQQPIVESGIYTDLEVQAANLRVRPSEILTDASRRYGRFDIANEWAYPAHQLDPYVQLRPFFVARYSGYEELLDPARGAEDRLSFGAGIQASQQWSRVFDTRKGFLDIVFGIDKMKHVVIPSVTYFNLFSNDLASSETIPVDEVDTVDLQESVSLSLRQAFVTRRNLRDRLTGIRPVLGRRESQLDSVEYVTRNVLDSEISFLYFPQSNRDNNGDPLSLVVFDNTLYPGDLFSLRLWAAVDVNNGFKVDTTDISTAFDVIPRTFRFTVGDRFTRRPNDPNRHFVYTRGDLKLGKRWILQGFWSHDIETGKASEVSFAVGRILHNFALILEYSFDPGENDNQSISVNFGPIQMLNGLRRGFLK